MADLKISALNSLAGADLVAADVVAVVDDSASETKKLTVSDLIANGTTLISDATIPSAKILFSAGSIATASVADSGITTAKVADSSITAAKLADNSSVTLVSTLPASGDFTGQIALDTDDNSIVVWNGSAWLSPVASGSINVVNGSNTGEVNIVATTSGSTVTISATLDNTTAAAQFLAGPTGAGGTVGYRAIIGTDLPTASTTAKGGVIVNGNGLTMSSDTIAINNTVTAETSENHIVQYDANGLITSGRAIVAADVPSATSTTVGVIKPGSGLGVTGAGELNHDNSVTAGTASKVTFDTEGHITGTESLVAVDIPDLDAAKITTGTLPTARIASDAITAEKLADKSTTTIAELTPSGGTFIGQGHLNSISGDFLIWDGNVWQPIGVSVGEIVLAGTYDANTNLMATVTSEGTALSFVVGSALPSASSANKGYYVVVSTAGTGTSPAPTVSLNPPDFLLSTGTAYTEIDVSSTVTAQQAANVAFTAAGNIAATNVQSAIEELDSEKISSASPSLTGTVSIGTGGTIQFEGATDNAFETTLTVVDPTADRSLSLPNVSGTLVSSGDTGTVTSAMIADGTIVNADISASAEIAVSKLANGTARQLLQTDVAGSGVEFTSNVDVPGTLDVTGTATLDSALHVTGNTAMGHTSPSHKLDVRVNNTAAARIGGTAFAMEIGQLGSSSSPGFNAVGSSASMLFRIGGTEAMRIDSNRRVGIGTASPSYLLDVYTQSNDIARFSGINGGSLLFRNASTNKVSLNAQSGDFLTFGTNGNSERLRIDTSGRVLINTSIEGEASAENLTIGDSSDCGISLRSGSTSSGKISFSDAYAGAAEYAGFLEYDHNVNALLLGTNSVERLRIDSSGRVGIGTNSPSDVLTVAGTDAFIKVDRSNGNPGIDFRYNGSTTNRGLIDVTSTGALKFAAGGNTERMRIDSSGNVGIGTTSPSAKLDVAGEVQCDSLDVDGAADML